jgi:glycerol-3-phosphate dehydrogenase
MSEEERREKIAENPLYGNIICRCETISEGEIINAIRRPLGAKTLDGVKVRTRAGMGRCQSGFCASRILKILARELNVKEIDITKRGGDSKILISRNKEFI